MPLAGHDKQHNTTDKYDYRFLLPCPSRGMTICDLTLFPMFLISTPMPLAGHDNSAGQNTLDEIISTPMPLAGHDSVGLLWK